MQSIIINAINKQTNQQALRLRGSAKPYKRARDMPVLIHQVQDNDPDIIKEAFAMAFPQDLVEFVSGLPSDSRDIFYKQVMSQKNSDRILKIFMEQITHIEDPRCGFALFQTNKQTNKHTNKQQ